MNRPLVWCAAAFALGVYAAAQDVRDVTLFAAVLLAAGLILVTRAHLPLRWRGPAAVLCFFAAGMFVFGARGLEPGVDSLGAATHHEPGRYYILEGAVRQADVILPGTNYASFVLDADSVMHGGERQPLAGGVHVRWIEPAFPVYPGERIRVEGVPEFALSRVNPGVNSFEETLRGRDIHTALRIQGKAQIERAGQAPRASLRYWAARFRHLQAEHLMDLAPESALPFLHTVWLGERRGIGQDQYDAFLRAGTAHILAVSGIHMGIVFLTVRGVLGMFVRNRRARALLVIAAVFAFAFVAGARVSALRAALMVAVYMLAECFDREPDTPSALGLAALILLSINPGYLFEIGFQLSFLSVSSILLFHEPIKDALSRTGLPENLRGAVAAPLAVQVLPLPLAAHLFHVLPLAAPLTNLIVVPLLTAVLWLTFLAAAAGAVWGALGAVFGHAAGAVTVLIETISGAVSNAPGGHVALVSPALAAAACYYGAVWIAWRGARARDWSSGRTLACAGLIIATPLLWRPADPPHEVVFLDVGHGDAIFVRSPGGGTMLVDGGDRVGGFDMGEREVAPFLRNRHVDHLDYVVATHAHSDHMGGLFHIIENFSVGEVILGIPSDTQLERSFLDACGENGVPVRRVARGDVIPLAGRPAEVLHPPEDWTGAANLNDESLVLRLRWDAGDILLTGDVEEAAERLLEEQDVTAALMQAPHHGSATSSTPGFIDAASPTYAVASTPGPPVLNESVMERYRERRIPVWRTDRHGGIQIRERGGRFVIDAARAKRGLLPDGAVVP